MVKDYIIGKSIWVGLLWYIFIVRIYKITEDIAQFSFKVLKNIENYNIFTLLYNSYLLALGFNYHW